MELGAACIHRLSTSQDPLFKPCTCTVWQAGQARPGPPQLLCPAGAAPQEPSQLAPGVDDLIVQDGVGVGFDHNQAQAQLHGWEGGWEGVDIRRVDTSGTNTCLEVRKPQCSHRDAQRISSLHKAAEEAAGWRQGHVHAG